MRSERSLSAQVPASTEVTARFNELLEGVRSDLAVKIIGPDYDVMEQLAVQTKAILDQVPGAGEVEFEAQGRAPVLEIILNRDALRRYNIHAADVNQTISTALAGQTVGLIYEGNRRHEVVVRLPGSLRERIEEIRALPVRVGEHGLVALEKVAEFRTVASVDPIVREEGHRRVALMVNLSGRDVESFVKDAEARITPETTALVAVDTYGIPCDYERLEDIGAPRFGGDGTVTVFGDVGTAGGQNEGDGGADIKTPTFISPRPYDIDEFRFELSRHFENDRVTPHHISGRGDHMGFGTLIER
mgnify:CR=1 FL=1